MFIKSGEYIQKGDYHKNLDKNWPFYPVYLAKMRMVENYLSQNGAGKKILDLGCGEGVLVEKLKSQKYDIVGVDLNYESDFVLKRPITDTGFNDDSFDVVMCLDVLEHLDFNEQEKALDEIRRVLKPNGTLVLTLPNLAHLASRLSFLFSGKLLRTSDIARHKGDRPIREFIRLIKNKEFMIKKRRGLFPTFPIISFLTYYFPGKAGFLHKFYNIFLAYPNWSFLNFIICDNKKHKNN